MIRRHPQDIAAIALMLGAFVAGWVVLMSGPALAGATREGAGASVTPSPSAPIARRADGPSTSSVATPRPSWTPVPGRLVSVALLPGETVRVLPYDVWRASLVIADDRRYVLLRTCFCESRWDTRAQGAAGEQGACQVMPEYHGDVPDDLREQFAQADRIAAANGLSPWTTRGGCEEWNR